MEVRLADSIKVLVLSAPILPDIELMEIMEYYTILMEICDVSIFHEYCEL